MPNVQITITCTTAAEAVTEMAELLAGKEQGIRPSALSNIMEEERQNGYKEGFNDGYTKGSNEAAAEAQQERAMQPSIIGIAAMLAHDTVSVAVQKGHLPFDFQPSLLTVFGRLSPNKVEGLGEAAIGVPRDTLGVYGFNMLTRKPMFLTRVDHWTLCPAK